MGKLNIFEISLSNPQEVYYGGQLIQGHVTVEITAEMKMRGIRLNFNGGAHVLWTERQEVGYGDNRRTQTVHYSSSEGYLDHCLILFGKAPGQSGEDPVLAPGRYTYPFSFQLPPAIPSSFEGYYGRVRYSIHGVIDRPWRFDHTTKRVFTVIGILDLNQEPLVPRGAQAKNQKNLCCFCCKSGPISASLVLDKIGYVPGEAILIKGEISNMSNRKMTKSFCQLTMTVLYHATHKTNVSFHKIATLTHGAILPGDSDIWNGDKLIIPPLPPSGLRGCSIIDIVYTVSLHVDPSGIACDLVVPINIIIGTIPLQVTLQQYGPPPLPIQTAFSEIAPLPPLPPQTAFGEIAPSPPLPLQTAFGETAPPQPLPPQTAFGEITPPPPLPPQTAFGEIAPPPYIPALSPPTYAESVFGKVNTQEENDTEYTRGSREYAPVYTYYNWNQHSPQEFQKPK